MDTNTNIAGRLSDSTTSPQTVDKGQFLNNRNVVINLGHPHKRMKDCFPNYETLLKDKSLHQRMVQKSSKIQIRPCSEGKIDEQAKKKQERLNELMSGFCLDLTDTNKQEFFENSVYLLANQQALMEYLAKLIDSLKDKKKFTIYYTFDEGANVFKGEVTVNRHETEEVDSKFEEHISQGKKVAMVAIHSRPDQGAREDIKTTDGSTKTREENRRLVPITCDPLNITRLLKM